VEFEGVEMFLALTANDEINSLAALNYAHVFDKQNVYQLPPLRVEPQEGDITIPPNLRGTTLFGDTLTAQQLRDHAESGSMLRDIAITETVASKPFPEQFPEAVSLFVVYPNGRIDPVLSQKNVPLVAGQTVIALVKPGTSIPEPASLPAMGVPPLRKVLC
jgi:hypothetical protein